MTITVQQEVDLERRYGSFGAQIHGSFDTSLTDAERDHCYRIFRLGMKTFHAELAAEHGETYPMGALVEKIDAATNPYENPSEVSA